MKRSIPWVSYRMEDIIFQPAITPLEAAMIPAKEPRQKGALALARASFAPGRARGIPPLRLPRLRGWGPHRQKI